MLTYFNDHAGWKKDVVLYPSQPDPDAVCQPISMQELSQTAYTLHNLELHCVTDKTPGHVHTEPDRGSCGLVFSLGGAYRYSFHGRSFLFDENHIVYLPTHGCYTHTFCQAHTRDNPWQSDMFVLNFRLRDPQGIQRILATEPTLLETDGKRYLPDILTLTEQFLSPSRQPAELIGKVYSILAALTKDQLYKRENTRKFQAISPALVLMQTTPPRRTACG